MGVYDADIETTAVVTQNTILLDLLENEFSDLNFREYDAAKRLKKELNVATVNLTKADVKSDLKTLERSLIKLIDRTERRLDELGDELLKRNESLGRDFLDSFGQYHYDGKRPYVSINILYCIIFCQQHNLNLYSFVLSTYVHELAHLYTHLGKDKDGKIWENFNQVNNTILEGLAQYYSYEYSKEIGGQSDFETESDLTDDTGKYLFSNMYREYKHYAKFSRQQVYTAMIFARRNGITDKKEFRNLLEHYKSEFPEG